MDNENENENAEEAIIGAIRYLVEGVSHGELTERECIQSLWQILDTPELPMQEPDGVPEEDAWWRDVPPNMQESEGK